jgi:hypothetical protein
MWKKRMTVTHLADGGYHADTGRYDLMNPPHEVEVIVTQETDSKDQVATIELVTSGRDRTRTALVPPPKPRK